MKADGQLLVVVPHGQSYGMLQDPTHQSFYVPTTFDYFCPDAPSNLYTIYRPHPWRAFRLHSSALHNIEAVLAPLKDPPHAKRPGKTKRRRAHAGR